MIGNIDHILVFKTNIKNPADRHIIQRVLDTHKQILEWSVDCQDIDCVLRIVSSTLCVNEIIELVKQNGYECCELE